MYSTLFLISLFCVGGKSDMVGLMSTTIEDLVSSNQFSSFNV